MKYTCHSHTLSTFRVVHPRAPAGTREAETHMPSGLWFGGVPAASRRWARRPCAMRRRSMVWTAPHHGPPDIGPTCAQASFAFSQNAVAGAPGADMRARAGGASCATDDTASTVSACAGAGHAMGWGACLPGVGPRAQ